MKIKIESIGINLVISVAEGSGSDLNELKFLIGLNHISNDRPNSFTISHQVYFSIEQKVNSIIRKKGVFPDESFRNFYTSIASQAKVKPKEIDLNSLRQNLKRENFIRELRPFQEKNVLKLISTNCGATFSVPGAGKTTEVLSSYAFFKSKTPELKLFVICPKNAFSAWDEQLEECFSNSEEFNALVRTSNNASNAGQMVRLSGGLSNINYLLDQSPNMFMITYQQLSKNDGILNAIAKYLSANECFCAVDESHRIKGRDRTGVPGVYASSVLNLSSICTYRYIMSGTPMPQSENDLINQYKFLYPRSNVSVQNVYDRIKSIYVRTNKDDLGIPEFDLEVIKVKMSPLQKELYDKIRYVERRRYETSSVSNRLRSLKRSIMRMLQISSNPRIIRDNEFYNLVKEQELQGLIEEYSPKFLKACEIARDLVEKGEKVIIWSGFRGNIELLESYLADLNPVVVDGQVQSSGDDSEEGTREFNIKKFKTNPECKVFIANPAAASEGISLHIDQDKRRLCSHAIYLDRNFNAAQFIQSVDRIHRLGITWTAKVFILKTEGSMDERVQERLDSKIEALRELLSDPSLKPYTSVDSAFEDDEFLLDPSSDHGISKEEEQFYAQELLG